MRSVLGIFLILSTLFIVSSCEKETVVRDFPIDHIPDWFPKMNVPEDNAFTQERWELGKSLFYETRLSINNSISCASCHDPELSFAKNEATSPGVFDRPGVRNATMLANIGFAPHLLSEGGVPTLETQVLVPIQEFNEFDHNILEITEELKEDKYYSEMAEKAYDREFDPWVLSRAISVFQRSFISANSSYDQYVHLGNAEAMTDEAIAGMELFNSEALRCAECHSGELFTSYGFANNGLKENYSDDGRWRLTGLESDRNVFKIPSLRNIALTAPYLHDGSIESLEEVIDLYSDGGYTHPNKSELLAAPMNLSEEEKAQLLAFLQSLTDETFVYRSEWQKE